VLIFEKKKKKRKKENKATLRILASSVRELTRLSMCHPPLQGRRVQKRPAKKREERKKKRKKKPLACWPTPKHTAVPLTRTPQLTNR
jgi:hypothetical protein